jgi:hypothetical protein
VHLLSKLASDSARGLVISFLDDPDENMRFAAINAVKLERIEQGVDKLLGAMPLKHKGFSERLLTRLQPCKTRESCLSFTA